MPRDFKLADRLPEPLRRVCSMTFWLQAGAFVIVGASLLQGGITLRTAETQAGVSAPGRPTDTIPAGRGLAESVARAAAATPSLASSPPLEGAQIALSTIDVIVTRNDTLDRIFRRLQLNLADLASLRSLPGVRTALDSLHPGELLHFTHHEGELFGLERRLSDTQTHKVSRDGDAL